MRNNELYYWSGLIVTSIVYCVCELCYYRSYIPAPILSQQSQVGNNSHNLSLQGYKGNMSHNLSPQATSLNSTQNACINQQTYMQYGSVQSALYLHVAGYMLLTSYIQSPEHCIRKINYWCLGYSFMNQALALANFEHVKASLLQ